MTIRQRVAAITHGVQIGASNTGPAAGGYTGLSTHSGDYTASTSGATVTGLNITGDLIVAAPDVTFVGCKIGGGVRSNTDPGGWIMRWCEVGPTVATGGVAGGIGIAVEGGFKELYRCDIHNGPDGAWMFGDAGVFESKLTETYIHDLFQPDNNDPHADGVQLTGPGTNGDTRITRSKIDVTRMYYWSGAAGSSPIYLLPGNAAIQSGDNWTTGTLTVEDNYLAGGNYTAQFLDAQAANGNFYVVTGNYFASGTAPTVGAGGAGTQAYPTFGSHSTANSNLARITWSDNREYDADTGTVGALIGV